MNDKLLDVQQVARRLGLHPMTVYRLVRTHKLPGIRVGGRWRFREESLESSWREAARETLTAAERRLGQLTASLHRTRQALMQVQSEFQHVQLMKHSLGLALDHGLRTPISSSLESMRLIHEGKLGTLTDQQRHALEISIRNLLRLLEELDGLTMAPVQTSHAAKAA